MSYIRPNYETARAKAGFGWSVSPCYHAPMALTGTSLREFNLKPEACIAAYRDGRPLMHEFFGDWLPRLAPATPPVSYGHVNCLGSELLFPDGGEVAHTHPYGSLDEAIERLQEPVEWAKAGMAPFFLDFWERMKAAFPDENVGFSFGVEGPLTTAYSLRGEGLFTDMFDAPEKTREFLRLTTASIIDYHCWRASLTSAAFPNPQGGGMVDDIASFVPHHMFDDFVMPYWEQYYAGITTGVRRAHVEDLRRPQLRYIEAIGLIYFDPSISHKLNPPMLRDEIRVPFGWRLGSFHYWYMDLQAVRDFVFQAAADGASSVFTIIEGSLCKPDGKEKIMAFKQAGEEAARILSNGGRRADLARQVSAAGRERFWARFPE